MDKRRNSGKLFLNKVVLGDLVTAQGSGHALTYVQTTTSVRDVTNIMASSSILSVPVWDATKNEFVSFISIIDVIRHFLPSSPEYKQDLAYDGPVGALLSVVGEEEENSIEIWAPSSAASMVMEFFALGIHRILVQDGDAALQPHSATPIVGPSGTTISQSDTVRYLWTHATDLDDILGQTVQESQLIAEDSPSVGAFKFAAVTADTPTIEVISKLFAHRSAAVPVVDKDGKFVTGFSMSNLRGLTLEEAQDLLKLSVKQFLDARPNTTPFTCYDTTDLKSVMKTLAENNAHRVWVIDGTGHLSGEITLTDILAKFAPFDYKKLHNGKI